MAKKSVGSSNFGISVFTKGTEEAAKKLRKFVQDANASGEKLTGGKQQKAQRALLALTMKGSKDFTDNKIKEEKRTQEIISKLKNDAHKKQFGRNEELLKSAIDGVKGQIAFRAKALKLNTEREKKAMADLASLEVGARAAKKRADNLVHNAQQQVVISSNIRNAARRTKSIQSILRQEVKAERHIKQVTTHRILEAARLEVAELNKIKEMRSKNATRSRLLGGGGSGGGSKVSSGGSKVSSGGGGSGASAANSRNSRKSMQGLLEASRGFEDALISGQIGGLRGALRASANNVSQMAFIMGGAGVGAIVGFAAAIATVALPALLDWAGVIKELGDVLDKTIERTHDRRKAEEQYQAVLGKIVSSGAAGILAGEQDRVNVATKDFRQTLRGLMFELAQLETDSGSPGNRKFDTKEEFGIGARIKANLAEWFDHAPARRYATAIADLQKVLLLDNPDDIQKFIVDFKETIKKYPVEEQAKLNVELDRMTAAFKRAQVAVALAKKIGPAIEAAAKAREKDRATGKENRRINQFNESVEPLMRARLNRPNDMFGNVRTPEQKLAEAQSATRSFSSQMKSRTKRRTSLDQDRMDAASDLRKSNVGLSQLQQHGGTQSQIQEAQALVDADDKKVAGIKAEIAELDQRQRVAAGWLTQSQAMTAQFQKEVDLKKQLAEDTKWVENVVKEIEKVDAAFKSRTNNIDKELDPFGNRLKEIGNEFIDDVHKLAEQGFGPNSPQAQAVRDLKKKNETALKLDILGKDKTSAQKALEKVGQGGPVGAIEKGSAEAFSSVQSAIRESRNNNSEPMQELVEINKKIEELQAEQLAFDKQHQTATIDSF